MTTTGTPTTAGPSAPRIRSRGRVFPRDRRRPPLLPVLALAALVPAACGPGDDVGDPARSTDASGRMDTAELGAPTLAMTLEGFEGPESVLYDGEQDVWFVSSFTGPSGERDGNGTVSRVDATTGTVVALNFAQPSDAFPFHAGRGMTLQGDSLWVADIDGVHAFHRVTGEQLAFVDLSTLEPGFLNDLAAGPDGTVWVTDTGGQRLIQVRPEAGLEVDISARIGPPNGILYDPVEAAYWIANWEKADTLFLWDAATGEIRPGSVSPGASRVDGLVAWGDRILAGVQVDSSIHVAARDPMAGAGWIRLPGRPADIGFDPGRGHVAVPYVALNQVQVWALPGY